VSNPLLDVSYQGANGALIHIHGGPDLTLEEINRVGELVTASMDQDANCIWGARVTDDMKGKLIVMTIMTGVKSPYIVGTVTEKQRVQERKRFSDDLGIEIVR
jgi:cell division protein FtsZ